MKAIHALKPALAGWAALILAGLAMPVSAGPKVVVSLKPLHSIAAAVMDGAGTPELLLQGAAATPHGYSLRPSQMRALSRADMVYWVGPELETFLSGPLATLPDTVQIVPLLEALKRQAGAGKGGVVLANRTADIWTSPGEAHSGDGQTADPHIWLDPVNGAAIAAIMAESLARADTEHAGLYRDNAERFAKQMQTLRIRTEAALSGVRNRPFIVFHDSFQYLERRFALKAVAAVTRGAHVNPGAAHLARLRAMLERGEAACLFIEPQFPPRTARALVRGTNARLGHLDPLGADLAPGPQAYGTLIHELTRDLTECLES